MIVNKLSKEEKQNEMRGYKDQAFGAWIRGEVGKNLLFADYLKTLGLSEPEQRITRKDAVNRSKAVLLKLGKKDTL